MFGGDRSFQSYSWPSADSYISMNVRCPSLTTTPLPRYHAPSSTPPVAVATRPIYSTDYKPTNPLDGPDASYSMDIVVCGCQWMNMPSCSGLTYGAASNQGLALQLAGGFYRK